MACEYSHIIKGRVPTFDFAYEMIASIDGYIGQTTSVSEGLAVQ